MVLLRRRGAHHARPGHRAHCQAGATRLLCRTRHGCETSAAPAPSSARTVRGSRGSGVDSTKSTESSRAKAGSSTHLGTGKQLSITGLDTSTPLMKINDTLLRGRRMDLFGTEIVLLDEMDPTRPREKQHRLQPVPPSTRDGRADARSSTTRKRIMFRPIYDPEARETSGGVGGRCTIS